MKYRNRILAVLLIVTCFLWTQSTRFLAADIIACSDYNVVDYYEINYEELIRLDGEEYLVSYSYDEFNNPCINILNTEKNKLDEVVLNLAEEKIYCNDEAVILISNSSCVESELDRLNLRSSSSWVLFGTISKTISKLETMTAMMFVAAVAAILGTYCTAAMVLSNMGATAVNYIISQFEKAEVKAKVYKLNSNLIIQFRYDWTVKPVGGSTYGPYTTLSSIN